MINCHCSVVCIEGRGILIEGASGSGKTSLALGLIEQAEVQSKDASFVTDDQALLSANSNKLLASAPKEIAGLVEIRGFGISHLKHEPQAEIHLVTKLIHDEEIERMPKPRTWAMGEIELPLLHVPMRHEQQAVRIVYAWLNSSDPEV